MKDDRLFPSRMEVIIFCSFIKLYSLVQKCYEVSFGLAHTLETMLNLSMFGL